MSQRGVEDSVSMGMWGTVFFWAKSGVYKL